MDRSDVFAKIRYNCLSHSVTIAAISVGQPIGEGDRVNCQSEDLGVKTRNKNRGDRSLGIVVCCH